MARRPSVAHDLDKTGLDGGGKRVTFEMAMVGTTAWEMSVTVNWNNWQTSANASRSQLAVGSPAIHEICPLCGIACGECECVYQAQSVKAAPWIGLDPVFRHVCPCVRHKVQDFGQASKLERPRNASALPEPSRVNVDWDRVRRRLNTLAGRRWRSALRQCSGSMFVMTLKSNFIWSNGGRIRLANSSPWIGTMPIVGLSATDAPRISRTHFGNVRSLRARKSDRSLRRWSNSRMRWRCSRSPCNIPAPLDGAAPCSTTAACSPPPRRSDRIAASPGAARPDSNSRPGI